MKSPAKPLSLADIHSTYASSPAAKPKAKPGEHATTTATTTAATTAHYKRSGHFKRDPGHPGMQPEKPDSMGRGAGTRKR